MDAAAAVALDYKDARYSRVAVWLHWSIAALILFNLPVGWVHDSFGPGVKPVMMTLHKSFGVIVFVLTCVRIVWRLSHPAPRFDPVLSSWEAALARAVHFSFYLVLFLMPMSGWLVTSASGVPVIDFLWLFKIQPLPVHGHHAHELWETVHTMFGYAMSLLVLVHVAGALKHVMDGHRQVLGRMAPLLYRGSASRAV